MTNNDKFFDLAITFLYGIGDINAKKVIAFFGSSKDFFAASYKDLLAVPGISETSAKRLFNNFNLAIQAAEDEINYVNDNNIGYVTFNDDNYPTRLRECVDAPMILYYKGMPNFNSKHIVSIVGTRNATKYGVEFCNNFVADLAQKYPDAVVVSGLAYGIDVTAHKAALENNIETWAVLGHSLETIYPAPHKKVAEKMVENKGSLISDFHHGSPVDPSNFVRRNRIVAGLCDALIVVESGEKGGSIITANIANNYNKDVFALPGNVTSTYSRGCNKLIKTTRANLCENFNDFEYIMNWSPRFQPTTQTLQFKYKMNDEEQKVADVLAKYEFLDIDNLRRQTQLPPNELSLILLQLELNNVVTALPGKIFSLKR